MSSMLHVSPVPSVRLPRHVRMLTKVWGGFFLAMAAVNASLVILGHADVYAAVADDSPFGLYRAVWQQLVTPHPLPWALALIAFEIAVGAAALGRGRGPLAALLASVLFVVGLIPASPSFTSWNALLALLPAYLLLRHLRGDGP